MKLIQNTNIFLQENAFEDVVWKTAAILFQPQCVNFDVTGLACISANKNGISWKQHNFFLLTLQASSQPNKLTFDLRWVPSCISEQNLAGSTFLKLVLLWHIEAWTKRLTICRWHFVMHFSNVNYCILLKFHSSLFLGPNWQYVSIGSCNGLAPVGCQAITWTNVDQDDWCHMASPGHNELNHRWN